MRIQVKVKHFLMLGLMVVLVGCGFHLRGSVAFPPEYKNVYIENSGITNSRDSVEFYIKRQLRSQVNFVDTRLDADLVFTISEGFISAATASNRSGARRDYTTQLQANINVVDTNGDVLLRNATFTKSRDFTVNEREPLAKTNAEEAINQELAQAVSVDFIRRLTTVIKARE